MSQNHESTEGRGKIAKIDRRLNLIQAGHSNRCLAHAAELEAERDRYRKALEACRAEAHNDWRVVEIVDEAIDAE